MANRDKIVPMTQLISRGLRKAPVKKTRNMCTVIETVNISAAQWWIWRMISPPRTSKLISTVDLNASLIAMPLSGT